MSNDVSTPATQEVAYPSEASREMMDAGVFYGRKKSKTNPKMRPFVIANRGGIEIINLQKTTEMLESAMAFLQEKVRTGGLVLLVGAIPAAEIRVTELAKKFNIPYVSLRWVGGAITNFKIIAKRVEHLKKLRSDLATGALVDKYTKKERLEMEREVRRLEELMGGLENMTREPDVMVVIDPVFHVTAIREARSRKIPIVALANVDANPDEIDYLVPGNDKAKRSIEWFLGSVEKAIHEGMKLRAEQQAAAASAEGEKATSTK
ncbi:MAG TPA: 30S ribosomal protein S2 [Candidatus Paceibacterota bacterium]|nr:30S ribosomal protein S2 [Candidatus Paceibacterota bacterium]